MQAAKVYSDAGAKVVYAITTHGLFTNNALEKIVEQNIIKEVITTNTHPNAVVLKNDKLKMVWKKRGLYDSYTRIKG